ncbi:MAG: hypothetical protein GTO40_27690, partial [Deltaproteobacteria bacterium]|nr:hypothetical protein [Deltaproteobacteria bacterium]
SDVDLAVLAIPPAATLTVLEEAVKKRVKSVLMVATGFGEFSENGRELQNKISALAKEGNVSISGPNTLGFLSTPGGVALWSSPLPQGLQIGGVGAVFHS